MNQVICTVDVVLLTIRNDALMTALIRREQEPCAGALALPGGYIHADKDASVYDAAMRVITAKAGIVPPYLTHASLLVYVSGAFELAGVVGLLIPRLRRYAGYGLMALVVAVSPANVHMWLHPELFPDFPRWVFAARLMFQLVLLWLIWWSCCRPSETDAA